jgi:hypothetical protein
MGAIARQAIVAARSDDRMAGTLACIVSAKAGFIRQPEVEMQRERILKQDPCSSTIKFFNCSCTSIHRDASTLKLSNDELA